MQDSNLEVLRTYSPADWMRTLKPTELSRIKLKTWTQQPVPMISEHSAYLTSLPVGFRTWLWRYACLLLITMLWHRQAIFESKEDKLSSSAECRIRTLKSQDTYSPADWMRTLKPTELSRIKLKTWTQQPVPMMSEHSTHLTSLQFGFPRYSNRKETSCLLLNAGFEPMQGLRHQIAKRLNACWQTDTLIHTSNNAKKIEITCPYELCLMNYAHETFCLNFVGEFQNGKTAFYRWSTAYSSVSQQCWAS